MIDKPNLIIGVDIGLDGGIAWLARSGGMWRAGATAMPVRKLKVQGKERREYDLKAILTCLNQIIWGADAQKDIGIADAPTSDSLCLTDPICAYIEKGEVYAPKPKKRHVGNFTGKDMAIEKEDEDEDEDEFAQGMGVLSAYRVGCNQAAIEGILACFSGVKVEVVRALQWRKVVFAPGKPPRWGSNKDVNVALAKKLFPDVNLLATARSIKPHTGIADALLVAEYGRRMQEWR